jgi:soluble lytic murein transglycosylase
MATIPGYTEPQIATRPLGAPQIRTVSTAVDNSGLVNAVGKLATKFVSDEREKADTALLMQAESQLQQRKLDLLFNPEQGVYTRKGQNALNVTNEALPQFDATVEEIGRGLKNDQQRARFAQIVQSQRNSLNGELNRYEYGERQAFYDEADKANIGTSLQGALQYADNPEMVAYYQNKGNAVLGSMAKRKGMSPEAFEMARNEFNSTLTTGVITRMASRDPMQAQQYFAKAAPGMLPGDQEKVGKLLAEAVRQQASVQIADSLWTDGSVGDDGLVALVVKHESGGQVDAVSPKGARGLMQLMPDTAKEMAGELGIPYDEQRLTTDPQYNMALGSAYLKKMIGRYGDRTLAVAAYNAGPGSVDKWLQENGDPRGGDITPAEWVAKIPYKETREYTGSIMADATRSAPAHEAYADGLKAAERLADPELKKLVIARLEEKKKAAKAETDALYEQAAEYVETSGYQNVPATLLSQLPADDRGKLRTMSDKLSKGQAIQTDYEKFEGFLAMPAERLGELSLARDIRPYLSDSDFNTVRSAWQAARKGDATPKEAAAAESKVVNRAMSMAGIEVGDNKDARNPDNLRRQQQFRAALEDRKAAYRLEFGKEPGIRDIEQMSDQLLLEVKITGGGRLFGDSTARPLWQVQPEQLGATYADKGDIDISDIPAMDRREIVEVLRASGRPATEANIKNEYLNMINTLGIEVK